MKRLFDLIPGLRRKKPRPVGLRVTRAGGIVIAISLALGFAALNTGSNLLFLGLGALLSSILVSGVWSAVALASLRVSAVRALPVRVGERQTLPVTIRNIRKRLPVWGVEVSLGFDVQETLEKAQLVLVHEAGLEKEVPVPLQPEHRGWLHVTRVKTSTRFPFGFFEKYRNVEFKERTAILVWPKRVPVDEAQLSLAARVGSAPSNRRGQGEELHSIRAFREGDDPKHILWRRYAKTGRKMLRQHQAQVAQQVVLVLGDAADIELAISTLGSLAEALLARGYSVGCEAPGFCRSPSAGRAQAEALWTGLALLDPTKAREKIRGVYPRLFVDGRGLKGLREHAA